MIHINACTDCLTNNLEDVTLVHGADIAEHAGFRCRFAPPDVTGCTYKDIHMLLVQPTLDQLRNPLPILSPHSNTSTHNFFFSSMPLVRIDVIRDAWSPSELKNLADTIQQVMQTHFNAPARDRYQVRLEFIPAYFPPNIRISFKSLLLTSHI